ncbi:hypothetical protein D3C73_1405890 [compost metagenome]
MVTPGIGMAWNVAAFNWLNWVSELGSTPMDTVTRLDSGTCAPLALLTWNCAKASGDTRCSRWLCGMTSYERPSMPKRLT